MKKMGYVVLIIILVLLFAKACIRRDIPEAEISNSGEQREQLSLNIYPVERKNITINGVDYLQTDAPIGKFGGTLINSTIGEGPKTFNPFNSKDATSSTFADLMYDGLVTIDPVSGQYIPKLAKSFEVKGNDYIVHLRHGLKWSDGKPITADDVYFTWKNIILDGYGNTSTRDSISVDGKLPTVTKIDDYTVKFTTPKPFAPFLASLSTSIAPKHIFEPAVKKGKDFFDTFLSTNVNLKDLVTSGPFKLVEYVPAQRAVYKRNPDYYVINSNGEKLPYLDKITYLIVGDANNEVLKFEGGELDVIGVKGSDVPRFKERQTRGKFSLVNLGPDTGTMYLSMNLNDRVNEEGKPYVNPTKSKWFSNKNFREAVDLAIDRENMVYNIANGFAKPLFTPESLNSIFLNKDLKPYPRDLEKARELLTQAGFKLDSKGRLRDAEGNRVEFDLLTNAGNAEREAIGVMVKEDLETLGMKVNFKPIEFNSLVNKLLSTYDWDMVVMGLTGSPLEPNGGKNVWLSNGALHMFNMRKPDEAGKNLLPWEKELDYLFEKGAIALSFDERKKFYDRYQEIIYTEKPMIYLYSPIRITAIRNKFKNIYPTTLGGVIHNIEEIYVDDTGAENGHN
ncbi:MAG: ABC transporter substrate-binding protein [Fusobacterium sp.]|nr:ABC transporter substrate-binding protein [Fusobacterium sp.]